MIIRNSNQEQIKFWLDISGIVNEDNIDPKITWDLKSPAAIIAKAVGIDEMRKLHQASIWLDVLFFISAWILFVGVWYFITTIDFGFVTVLLLILQGIVLGNLFYAIRHDMLMHRQIGGARLAYILGILMSIPMLNLYTHFLRHEDHHLHVGYDLFEEHIADLDTIWKRWLGITGIGFILLFSGKLKTKNAPKPNAEWKSPALILKATRNELRFHLIWVLGIFIATFLWPYAMILGYIIPVIIVIPFLLAIKHACQHSETDVNNSMHVATSFKSNFLVNILYCCALGDVHLVHHLFPRIPFWKTPKAARLFSNILIVHNVPKRSLLEVLAGYYLKGKPYRKRWLEEEGQNS